MEGRKTLSRKMKKKFKNFIVTASELLRREIFHGEYKMSFCWHIESRETSEDRPGREVAARIDIDPTYLNFEICVFSPLYSFFEDGKYEDILEALIHEFCHLLTAPICRVALKGISPQEKGYLEDIEERQTQRIANAIFRRIPKTAFIKEALGTTKKKKPLKSKKKG